MNGYLLNTSTEVQRLVEYIRARFQVDPRAFLEAIKLSPNAQGGIIGALTEYLLKTTLEKEGFLVERIPEKWEGEKQHHGDFYVSRGLDKPAYILESKGLKSNAEIVLLGTKRKKGQETKGRTGHEVSLRKLIRKLRSHYDILLNRNKVPKANSNTEKDKYLGDFLLQLFPNLDFSSPDETRIPIDELTKKLRLLVSHFVNSKSSGSREQNTPAKTEFHIVAVNLFIKLERHVFIYAPVTSLPEGKRKGHLKQNYFIGFAYRENTDEPFHYCLDDIWSESFLEVFAEVEKEVSKNSSSIKPAIKPEEKHVDRRGI
jgi:hypothetical protein